MTVAILIATREGAVLGTDSTTTLNLRQRGAERVVQLFNSAQKVFEIGPVASRFVAGESFAGAVAVYGDGTFGPLSWRCFISEFYCRRVVPAGGALDVYATPVQMKKNRPGLGLTVVCAEADIDALCRLIFTETTTIGVRYKLERRKTLERRSVVVQTEYGAIRMKVSLLEGRRVNAVPEFEDCRRAAAERGVALKEVQAAAGRAFFQAEASGRIDGGKVSNG